MTIIEKLLNPIIRLTVNLTIRIFGLLYGYSYRRFFVLETVARIPYFSYLSVLHLYQSLGVKPSLDLLNLHFHESINEEYHLMIMEELGGGDNILDKIFARTLGVLYYWAVVVLYIISPLSGYYLMVVVEQEAVSSYDYFIQQNQKKLSKSTASELAKEYYFSSFVMQKNSPKASLTMLDIFKSIRDDEKEHVKDMKNCSQNFQDFFTQK